MRDAEYLYGVARASIETGLQSGNPLEPDLSAAPEEVRSHRASFVTLHLASALRGCVGTLEASRPLAIDVAHNAFRAAFWDPRFAPLARSEFTGLDIHISVLGEPEALPCDSETELLNKLRPQVDGLILYTRRHRATFLPSVWEQAAEPREFVRNLKVKAGLPADYWSSELRFERYTADSLPNPSAARATPARQEPSGEAL